MTSYLIPSILGTLTFSVVVTLTGARAEMVAEWKFDPKENIAGGASVPIDTVRAGASTESTLLSQTTCSSGATGLGDKWKAFLTAGYLDVPEGSGDKAKDQYGLVTKNTAAAPAKSNGTYKNYLGFSGYGNGDKGGTVYLVVSPNDNWATSTRHGLFGLGHLSDDILNVFTKSGVLIFKTGGKGSGGVQTADSKVTITWDPAKWYFIGASCQESSAPVLYVREMNVADPAASPAGTSGTVTGLTPVGSTEPAHDPIAVGSQWIDTGAVKFTMDGADGRIAYARVDNVYTPATNMDAALTELGAGK